MMKKFLLLAFWIFTAISTHADDETATFRGRALWRQTESSVQQSLIMGVKMEAIQKAWKKCRLAGHQLCAFKDLIPLHIYTPHWRWGWKYKTEFEAVVQSLDSLSLNPGTLYEVNKIASSEPFPYVEESRTFHAALSKCQEDGNDYCVISDIQSHTEFITVTIQGFNRHFDLEARVKLSIPCPDGVKSCKRYEMHLPEEP